MGNEDKAELLRIQGAARRKKGDFDSALKIGLTKSEMGENQEAIQFLNKAIEFDRENIDAYNMRAEVKKKSGDIEGAKKDFAEAESIKNKKRADDIKELETPLEYVKRGNLKLDKGDLNGALDDFNKALEMDPTISDVYLNRGAIKQALGDNDGANCDFKKARELQTQAS